jgi:MoaA/NifB/PqqE/SkfB family radical SAM enzyme
MILLQNRVKKLNQKIVPRHLFYGPDWVILGVNNACNLHCKMCDIGNGNTESNFSQIVTGSKPLNMPLELFKRICDELVKFNPKPKIGFVYTEPLIYPHLLASLDYAQQKGIFTAIVTNGLKLKDLAYELSMSGLKSLNVSLDGPPETHNKIRGNSHSFELAFAGIKKILELSQNKIKISVCHTITEWNYDKMTGFLHYFKDLPLEQIAFLHPNFVSDLMALKHNERWGNVYPATESCLSNMNLDKISLSVLLVQIREIRKIVLQFPVSFYPDFDNLSALSVYYNDHDQTIGKQCQDVMRNIMVKSNGDVLPGIGRCYNITVGNLYQNSLKKIWNSKTLAQFRSDLIKSGGLMPGCNRCCGAFQ